MAIGAPSGRAEKALSIRKSVTRRLLSLALGALLAGGVAAAARADTFFDWLGEPANPAGPGYVTAPTLTDATAAQVDAFLTAQQALGRPLAVKVTFGTTLSAATVNTIFNGHNVKFIFSDFEGPSTVAQVTALVNQIRPTVTGAGFATGQNFIGNYALSPITTDPTHPNSASYTAGNSPTMPYLTATDFRNSGVNMAAEELYPGDASFRNPIFGANPTVGAGSDAPNIRSALFTLPVQRLSAVTQNMGSGQQHIPFISRFNNWDNPALGNSATNINGVPGHPVFDTSGPAINGQPVAGQLLSRNDFQALALHYRMRGANGYHLLDPGVQGYTQAQEESDALTGWNNGSVASVLAGVNGRVASLPTTVNFSGGVTPGVQSMEHAGVVWSAVTNDNATPELEVLVSNLSPNNGTVTFNTRINGATLSYTSPILQAGSHTLLHFTKAGGIWGSAIVTPAFNDATLASRDGIGIPEPASLGLLGVGAIGILARRRRKA
jgi:hypothetical protein